MEVTQRRKEGRKRKRWKKSPAGDAPSRRELRRRCAPTMVTHDLPSSLQTDILQIVVAAFLVLLQRTALLVAPAAVVALVRLPHCGKNESMGSDPRLASAIHRAHTSATNNSCDGKTPKKGYSSPRPFSQPRFPPPHTPPPTRRVLCPIRFSHQRCISRRKRRRPWWQSK